MDKLQPNGQPRVLPARCECGNDISNGKGVWTSGAYICVRCRDLETYHFSYRKTEKLKDREPVTYRQLLAVGRAAEKWLADRGIGGGISRCTIFSTSTLTTFADSYSEMTKHDGRTMRHAANERNLL